MKTYKNYLRNKAKRRNNPMIRQIRNGEIVKKWEKPTKPVVHENIETVPDAVFEPRYQPKVPRYNHH